MGLARKLEQRLEQLVDGLSAALFRGGVHPVELAGRLVRHADLLVSETEAGPTIPNVFTVRVNPSDLADDVDRDALDKELTRTIDATAAERGWLTDGPLRVEVRADDGVVVGAASIEAASLPGPIPPWAQLIDIDNGSPYDVADNRCVIGRSSSATVTLPNPEISRRHALIFRKAGSVWLIDLGSANGTRLNGEAVADEPRRVHAGDQITFGSTTLSLRLV